MEYKEPTVILDPGESGTFFRVLWNEDLIKRWVSETHTHLHLDGIQSGVCAFGSPRGVATYAEENSHPNTFHYVTFLGTVIRYIGKEAEPGAYIVNVDHWERSILSYQEILNMVIEEESAEPNNNEA